MALLNKSEFENVTCEQLQRDINELQICIDNKFALSTSIQNSYLHSQVCMIFGY